MQMIGCNSAALQLPASPEAARECPIAAEDGVQALSAELIFSVASQPQACAGAASRTLGATPDKLKLRAGHQLGVLCDDKVLVLVHHEQAAVGDLPRVVVHGEAVRRSLWG